MVVATPFPEPFGWQYFTNESTWNIFYGTRDMWSGVSYGYAWLIIQLAFVFLAGYIVYNRTQNGIATSFIIVLLTNVLGYYKLMDHTIILSVNIIVVLLIAIQLVMLMLKKRNT